MLSSSNYWPSYPKKSKSLTSRLVLLPWCPHGPRRAKAKNFFSLRVLPHFFSVPALTTPLHLALRWNHVLNDRLFLNTHLTYTRYQFDVSTTDEARYTDPNGLANTQKFSLLYLSNIADVSAKMDFDYVPNPAHYVQGKSTKRLVSDFDFFG